MHEEAHVTFTIQHSCHLPLAACQTSRDQCVLSFSCDWVRLESVYEANSLGSSRHRKRIAVLFGSTRPVVIKDKNSNETRNFQTDVTAANEIRLHNQY